MKEHALSRAGFPIYGDQKEIESITNYEPINLSPEIEEQCLYRLRSAVEAAYCMGWSEAKEDNGNPITEQGVPDSMRLRALDRFAPEHIFKMPIEEIKYK